MNILKYTNEGPLHKKLRKTRCRYRIAIASVCTVAAIGVFSAAAALITLAHYNSPDPVVVAKKDDECVPALRAGISLCVSEDLTQEFREAKRTEQAHLLTFDENTEWCDDAFTSFAKNFSTWCFAKPQLTIDFAHTYTINETVVSLASVNNVINTVHSTGFVNAVKPTYGLGMYYNYETADYYTSIIADNDDSTGWVHVSPESDHHALQFCQESVLSTTSVNTVQALLKILATSGVYNTQEGMRDAYYVSWQGTISNQLLTPTFDTTSPDYVTRVDLQCFDDTVYCIVTYVYMDSTSGVTEESYSYKFLRTDTVINYELPDRVTSSCSTDVAPMLSIIKEI